MAMANIDPYSAGKFKSNPYAKKSDVYGPLVVILDGQMEDRGLQLIVPVSRCVRQNDVHELILTDEQGAKPGARVNRIAYLGFFTVERGGVIVQNDQVFLNDFMLGHLAGFDETHMPNHLNIVIKTDKLFTGVGLGAEIDMCIKFT